MQWTFFVVIYICEWLLLSICYRETNAKVAADFEREELEIKLQNAELLAKKRDDEVNSYRKEVRVSTPFVEKCSLTQTKVITGTTE